jgi:hypothetical protein
MVIIPRRKEDRLAAEKILYEEAGVQMHIASIKGYETRPRQLLYAAFDFPFNVLHVDLLIGVINSLNIHALKFDLKLGFREKTRWKNMHEDGGDLIILEMHKNDCRWLRK